MKGQDSAKYKNFDTSYITDWVISRKPLKFKKASPEYLLKLNKQLKRDRRINHLKHFVVGLIILPILSILGAAMYDLLFWLKDQKKAPTFVEATQYLLSLSAYNAIPIKDLKASPINPVMSMVNPRPLSPLGTLEYFNRSRIAASATIAIMKPVPDPNPYAVASTIV